jgi:L-arabinokinase
VLLTGPLADGAPPANARRVDGPELEAAGLRYEDLVAAADAVLTKPGYGIVTDCIAARTRLVYTERGDFAEYPVMVAEMPRYLPAVHAANDDVREGRLHSALSAVLELPYPDPPRLDGAAVVATRLLGACS